MAVYKFNFEFENFNDGKGRLESSLQYALDNLTYNGLIYATTEYPTADTRIMICVVNLDRNEISGKTIEEVEKLLDEKVQRRRFPPNRPLEKLIP